MIDSVQYLTLNISIVEASFQEYHLLSDSSCLTEHPVHYEMLILCLWSITQALIESLFIYISSIIVQSIGNHDLFTYAGSLSSPTTLTRFDQSFTKSTP